jgi:general secretion pathway protein G
MHFEIFLNQRFKKLFFNSKLRIQNSQFPRGLVLREGGFTLVEMLVVLAILAVLTAVTLPYAEVTVRRDRELELKRDLREMRIAIDRFHYDWQSGVIPQTSSAASDDGYPKTLEVLTRGADSSGVRPVKQKYLRRVPENPLGDTSLPPEQQWGWRAYGDPPDSTAWGGADVYDIYCPGDGKALDGSFYHDW